MQAAFVFFGVGGGPLLGVFTLGMLSRRCSQKVHLSLYFRYAILRVFGQLSGFMKFSVDNVKTEANRPLFFQGALSGIISGLLVGLWIGA